jgi:hypothetical protein
MKPPKEMIFTADLAIRWLATYPPTNPHNPERIKRFASLMRASGIKLFENRPRARVRAYIGINKEGEMEIGPDFLRAIIETGNSGVAQIIKDFPPIKKELSHV